MKISNTKYIKNIILNVDNCILIYYVDDGLNKEVKKIYPYSKYNIKIQHREFENYIEKDDNVENIIIDLSDSKMISIYDDTTIQVYFYFTRDDGFKFTINYNDIKIKDYGYYYNDYI